jgi:hypothetical protein
MTDRDVGPEPRWWRVVEREVARRTAGDDATSGADGITEGGPISGDEPDGLPDPWADRGVPVSDLTPAQRAVLEGFDDQPWVPRLRGVDTDGAAPDQPPPPRLAADESSDETGALDEDDDSPGT